MTAPATLNAKTLNLAVDSINAFTTNATTITAAANKAGNLAITDTATAAVTLNAIAAKFGDVTFSTGGALTAKGTITAGATNNVSLTDSGLLATKGAITAGKNVTLVALGTKGAIKQGGNITADPTAGIITLTANGTGTGGTIIDAAAGTYQANAHTVNLTTNGANIGTTSAGFRTGNTGPITINVTTGTTGAVNITNKDTIAAGSVTLGTATVGSLKLTATNTVSTNTGTLTIGTITAGTAAIFVTTSEQNLLVAAGSNVTTKNGNITLQDTNIASNTPTITIGDGSTIWGSTPGQVKTAGNVFIAIGNVPTSSTVRPGTTPVVNPPDTSKSITPTLITYGTTTNLAGSITTGAGDIFTSKSRNLSFTTGTTTSKATQITVGKNVTIIADPPEGAAVSAASTRLATTAMAPPIAATPALTATAPVSAAAPLTVVATSATIPSAANQMVLSGGLTPIASYAAALSNSAVASTNNHLIGGVSTSKKLHGHFEHGQVEHQVLNGGATLLAPDHDTVVETAFGPVSVAAGAVAMLVNFDGGLAVYDLHDSRKGAVVVGAGPQGETLVPGRSAVLTRKAIQSFEDINPAPFVGYRQVQSRAMDSETRLFQAEFEIMSMMRGIKPLSAMLASDKPSARKTMTNVLKTAAILMQLTQSQKPFKSYVAQEKMACLPQTNQ